MAKRTEQVQLMPVGEQDQLDDCLDDLHRVRVHLQWYNGRKQLHVTDGVNNWYWYLKHRSGEPWINIASIVP